MKVKLRLIGDRPIFYMISDNPSVSFGIVDCSIYPRRIAPKDDYHKKGMDMHAYTPVELNFLENLLQTSVIPARQNQYFQKNVSNNAPVRQIDIARNTNSVYTGFYTANPFWYEKVDITR